MELINKKKTLKAKKVRGRITVLKIFDYENHLVYIRKINNDIFEYLLIHEGKIFSSYIIITPEEEKRRLTKKQLAQTIVLISVAAETTIDYLIKEEIKKLPKAPKKEIKK